MDNYKSVIDIVVARIPKYAHPNEHSQQVSYDPRLITQSFLADPIEHECLPERFDFD